MRLATAPQIESRAIVSNSRALYSALAFYFAVLLLGFPFFRYLIAPDPISYISIARHYAAGDWENAINTYWSPLISWLIAPLLLTGIPGLIAIKIVTILSGVAALVAAAKLARGFELSPGIETVVLCTAALMIAAYSLLDNGPDVLVIAITLFYFNIIFDRSYERSRTAGALCGILGALSFFTKTYLFCFFLAHFTIITALRLIRQTGFTRKQIFSNYIAGLIVFLIGCCPWLLAIRAKTGTFDLGTTAAWNERMVGPESPGYAQYYGLIPPPGPQAISMWELPAPGLLPDWHPLGSSQALKYQLKLISQNLKWLRTFLLESSLLSFAALFCYFLWGISHGGVARYSWLLVLATLLILPSGYLLITIEDRYIWPALLLILFIGAVVIDSVTRGSKQLVRRVAIIGYALSFALFPIRELIGNRNGGEALFRASSAVRSVIPARSRLATCGSWNDSLAIAYYSDLRFYGSTGATPEEDAARPALIPVATPENAPAPLSPSEIADSLQKNRIAYYLVWPACRVLPPATLLTEPINLPGLPGAKIFHVSGLSDKGSGTLASSARGPSYLRISAK